MIVRDNESTIVDCLESIKDHVDEIIVVDTGSKDRTVELVSKYTDKIYYHEWENDFAKARNHSLDYATQDLILWLDSDDFVPVETRAAIDVIRKVNDVKAAYAIRITNVNCVEIANRAINNYYNPLKIFPRREDIRFERPVHEQVDRMVLAIPEIEIRGLDCYIEHRGYSDEETYTKKILRNIRISATESMEKAFGKKVEGYIELRHKDYFCFFAEGVLLMYKEQIDFGSGYSQIKLVSETRPFETMIDVKHLTQEKIVLKVMDAIKERAEFYDEVFEMSNTQKEGLWLVK